MQEQSINLDTLTGLNEEDVKERIEKYGYNEINEKEETWFHRLFKKFWGPIPWMIEIAVILSAIAHRWEDFSVIMLMLLVNAFVDFYQESKALSAISVLKKKLARKALVLREGEWKSIDAKEVVPSYSTQHLLWKNGRSYCKSRKRGKWTFPTNGH